MRILKIIGIVLLALALIITASIFIFSEKEPEGTDPRAADEMTQAMLRSVNDEAWQNTRYLSWSFMNVHDYVWDKAEHVVKVSWDENEVTLHTKTVSGTALSKGKVMEGKKKDKLIQKAWSFFCNDSFWLNPVTKAFDPGTTRTMVTLKDGREGLKVKYESGGVTPGDAYVWILDENHRPTAWKMWVQVLPLKGLEVPWTEWKQLSTGAYISTLHKGLISIDFTEAKAGQTLTELGLPEDYLDL